MKTCLFLPLLVIFGFNGSILAQQVLVNNPCAWPVVRENNTLKGVGQWEILLNNPSFEETPGAGKVPSGWINLGSEFETPPDIQPGFFEVIIAPQHGNTYLGLAVRETGTCEGVGQKLNSFLKEGSTYTLSIWLSRSDTFQSPVGADKETRKNFTSPTILKIWGYNTKTSQDELLAESQPVDHSDWLRYEFKLRPRLADYDELDMMAYYAPGHEKENGNLLIDNCSSIVKVDR